MDALDDLAHTSLDASLVTQVGNVLATLTNDHAGLLGRHDSSQGQLRLRILLVGLGRRLSVRSKAGFVVVEVELVQGVIQLTAIGRLGFL